MRVAVKLVTRILITFKTGTYYSYFTSTAGNSLRIYYSLVKVERSWGPVPLMLLVCKKREILPMAQALDL